MEATQINKLVQSQRHFFLTGTTLDVNVRIDALKNYIRQLRNMRMKYLMLSIKTLAKASLKVTCVKSGLLSARYLIC